MCVLDDAFTFQGAGWGEVGKYRARTSAKPAGYPDTVAFTAKIAVSLAKRVRLLF